MQLTDLTVFNEIQERVNSVDDFTVEFANAKLAEVGSEEHVIGPVEPLTKRLMALTLKLQSEEALELAMGCQLQPSELLKDHSERAIMLKQMYTSLTEIVWLQARFDTGYWEAKGVGIRKGFILISVDYQPSVGDLLRMAR